MGVGVVGRGVREAVGAGVRLGTGVRVGVALLTWAAIRGWLSGAGWVRFDLTNQITTPIKIAPAASHSQSGSLRAVVETTGLSGRLVEGTV